jgi:hypothetical protein
VHSTHPPPAHHTHAVPGVEILDWKIPDPHGQSVDAVREIRDYVKGQVLALAAARGWKLRG